MMVPDERSHDRTLVGNRHAPECAYAKKNVHTSFVGFVQSYFVFAVKPVYVMYISLHTRATLVRGRDQKRLAAYGSQTYPPSSRGPKAPKTPFVA